ncbi:uncharacterized protein DS421_14g471840 [Arachis hypogaea]|nr:uncharacterized protein DS421_14g471840 [Arachis hypogaea]
MVTVFGDDLKGSMVTVFKGDLKVCMITVLGGDLKESTVTVFQKSDLKGPPPRRTLPPPPSLHHYQKFFAAALSTLNVKSLCLKDPDPTVNPLPYQCNHSSLTLTSSSTNRHRHRQKSSFDEGLLELVVSPCLRALLYRRLLLGLSSGVVYFS